MFTPSNPGVNMKVKILLYKSKVYKDGTSPVVATINIGRSPKRKVLFSIDPKDWDSKNNLVKKSNALYPEFNRMITEKQYEYDKKIINAQINDLQITEDYIFGSNNSVTLIDAFNDYIDILNSKGKTPQNFKAISTDISNFGNIPIVNINNDWAIRFYNHLKTYNSKNTAGKKIQRINTVLKPHNVSIKIETPKERTTKNKLNADELLSIKNLPLSGLIEKVRDTFLLSFYLRGRRIGDVLTLEYKHYQNGRIVKDANKTDKLMNIKVIPQAAQIIEKYAGASKYYLLPFMKYEPEFQNNQKYKKQIESNTTLINRYLKIIADMAGIDKNLSTHVAKHTFAYLGDQFGLSGKRIQDMLEHSDLRTTENYIYDLNNSDMLDDAMDDFMSKLDL